MSIEYRIEEFSAPFGQWFPVRDLEHLEDLESAKIALNEMRTQVHRRFRMACRHVGGWCECKEGMQWVNN